MKKLISVMLVAVMLLSLSVVAFADGNSETTPVPQVKVEKATDSAGKEVTVTVSEAEDLTTAETTAAQAAAVANVGTGATLGEPFDITVPSDPNAQNVTVVIAYTGTGTVAGVLYQNTNGSWDYAKATAVTGGYQVTLAHFCTAMLVFAAPAPTTTTTPSTTTTPATSSSGSGVTSPKTGWD